LNELLRDLAVNPIFEQLVNLQRKSQHNATKEELVLKFFAYKDDREAFRGSVKDFLNDWMRDYRETDRIDEFRSDFERTVESVFDAVGRKKFLRSSTPVTPQNELEAVMVAAAEVLAEYGKIGSPADGWLDDAELVEASTGATNTRTKLKDRVDRAKVLLTPP
jgi:hypothetical protein